MSFQPKNAEVFEKIDPKLNEKIVHPPKMKPIHYLKLATILLTLLYTSAVPIIFFHLIPFFVLFSLKRSDLFLKLVNVTMNWWFKIYLNVFETLNKPELIMTGTEIKKDDWALTISNHPSEADWLYFWSIIERSGNSAGNYRVILKQMLKDVPGLGWGMTNSEYLMISRNWEEDEKQFEWTLNRYSKHMDPFFLVLFPEGTDFTPVKLARCALWAAQNEAPIYRNLLTPKVKGFQKVVSSLNPKLKTIYDFTIAYDDNVKPNLIGALAGSFPKRVHIHIRRYDVNLIGKEDPKQLEKFLYQIYKEKDDLIDYFRSNASFPKQSQLDKNNSVKFGDSALNQQFLFGNSPIFDSEGKISSLKDKKMTIEGWMWLVVCIIMNSIVFYWMKCSTLFTLFIIASWIFLILSSSSKTVRVWRGVNPPSGWSINKKNQ